MARLNGCHLRNCGQSRGILYDGAFFLHTYCFEKVVDGGSHSHRPKSKLLPRSTRVDVIPLVQSVSGRAAHFR